MKKSKQISLLIAVAIIIVGIIVISTIGFNYSIKYNNSVSIIFEIEQEKALEDLENISNEILGNKLKNVTLEENLITIKAKEVSDEEKQNLVNKVNDKYATELKTEDLKIDKTLKVDFLSIIYNYAISIISIICAIVIYFVIKYRKQKIWKVALYSLVSINFIQLLYFSIIAIARIPVSNLIIPIAIVVLMITVYFVDNYLDKKMSENRF